MTTLDPASRPPVDLGTDGWRFAARLNHWTDGDTVVVDCLIDVGFEEMVTKRRRIRLLGINAPESHSSDPTVRAAGQAATAYVEQMAPAGSIVDVVVAHFDKYGGRDDGSLSDSGGDYAARILAAGHAVPYDGGAR